MAENCLQGNPASEWDVKTGDAGDPTIQGFATDISVNAGDTVFFKIKTPATSYTINIYRMGYYGGLGARRITSVAPSATLPQSQPPCISDSTVGLSDCGNWNVSASWQVPANAVSGIYFAHLIRSDTGGDSHIVFIVRNDAGSSAILFQTADAAWEAYNYYGGGSLYGPASPQFEIGSRSYKVSYNRPFLTRGFGDESDTWVFGAEFPMVQWLEQNGYDVSYFTSIDAARTGALIQKHKIYLDSGHDEYWNSPQRTSVEAARNAGVNLAFFSGNESFWKTRLENSIDGTNTPNRTLVCYKETLDSKITDTNNPNSWTGSWRDPRFSPPADGGYPENAMTGTLFEVNGPGTDNDGSLTMKVPAEDGKMRFWRGTAAATQAANSQIALPAGSLGYEWDEDVDNGFRPAGAFHLSQSTYQLTTDLLFDYGATFGAGTATHHMMMYRAPSGALVFGAGTVNWAWGLSSNHDNPFGFTTPAPEPTMQQATVNLFADMGVQPATLQAGLVAATASTDTVPPVSVITTPSSGVSLVADASTTISGTATDQGGAVAGVEISTDNGNTWHPATGRATWSYTFVPALVGQTTILSRAVDDSGNLERPAPGVNATIIPRACPCTIWSPSTTPSIIDGGDGGSVELGVRFRSDANGVITGLRFYKATTNTGTHIGHIWSNNGTLLGTATFSGETASGWQQVNFATPIPVVANTTYVASYFAPNGHYSISPSYFAAGVDNPPMHALQDGLDGADGTYAYSPSGGYPNSTYQSANYWVDAVFTPSNTSNISGTLAGYGAAAATVTLSGAASTSVSSDPAGNYTFANLVNGNYTITPSAAGIGFTPVSSAVTLNGNSVIAVNFTGTLANPLTISGTVGGAVGGIVTLTGSVTASTTTSQTGAYTFTNLAPGTYTITPSMSQLLILPNSQTVTLTNTNQTTVNFQSQACNCLSIWAPTTTPTLVDSGDGNSVEVGVKFTVDTTGSILGLRFYKAAANTGVHIGHLWSSSGTLLATATFTGEGASGWQQATFSSPVTVLPGETYIASYLAPAGHYSADTKYFATQGVDTSPLHALAEGVNGSNGVYLYTSSGGYPSISYNSANYWVDILYQASAAYSLSGNVAAGAGATVNLTGNSNGSSQATTTADASGNYTFANVSKGNYSVEPTLAGAIYSPAIESVTIANSPVTGVNFGIPPQCPCNTIWQSMWLPAVVDSGDSNAYELGVKFRADADGYVLGIRFYKSARNTGTHIGNLWSSSGVLLGSATFLAEGSSGWQQVLFANAVAVKANTTYVASYFDPAGFYSFNSGLFASAGVDAPPLHALGNGVDGPNGVFTASTTSVFPSSSYNASAYAVDVIYANPGSYSVGGTISGTNAAGSTLTLTGPSTVTTTADSNGSFLLSKVPDGQYTLTPSKSGVVFTPYSQVITVNGAHQLAITFASN
ncbi:MAG: DUF4082 domain-containing protein [Acidobacteria bacterium]|nr:DUF4082 domain-containing protein [Acidobacteriota bacterium]